MSYYSTPRTVPSAPFPTPSSTASSRQRIGKGPIHNPFDKFTQPEFDDWISDITGALRSALGHYDSGKPKNGTQLPSTGEQTREDGASDIDTEDALSDDSFAELKTRRAYAKGKGRDPRDGPGLLNGKGSFHEPINLVDSDEEEDGDQDMEHSVASAEDEGHDSDVIEVGSGSEDENEQGPEEDDHYYEELRYHHQPLTNGEELEYDELEGSEEEASPVVADVRPLAEEGDGEAGQDQLSQADEDVHADLSIEEQADTSSEQQLGEDDDEIQLLDDDTNLPSTFHEPEPPTQDIEIADPWAGPQTFAEDFYAGGDRIDPQVDAHHLGEAQDNELPLQTEIVTLAAIESANVPPNVEDLAGNEDEELELAYPDDYHCPDPIHVDGEEVEGEGEGAGFSPEVDVSLNKEMEGAEGDSSPSEMDEEDEGNNELFDGVGSPPVQVDEEDEGNGELFDGAGSSPVQVEEEDEGNDELFDGAGSSPVQVEEEDEGNDELFGGAGSSPVQVEEEDEGNDELFDRAGSSPVQVDEEDARNDELFDGAGSSPVHADEENEDAGSSPVKMDYSPIEISDDEEAGDPHITLADSGGRDAALPHISPTEVVEHEESVFTTEEPQPDEVTIEETGSVPPEEIADDNAEVEAAAVSQDVIPSKSTGETDNLSSTLRIEIDVAGGQMVVEDTQRETSPLLRSMDMGPANESIPYTDNLAMVQEATVDGTSLPDLAPGDVSVPSHLDDLSTAQDSSAADGVNAVLEDTILPQTDDGTTQDATVFEPPLQEMNVAPAGPSIPPPLDDHSVAQGSTEGEASVLSQEMESTPMDVPTDGHTMLEGAPEVEVSGPLQNADAEILDLASVPSQSTAEVASNDVTASPVDDTSSDDARVIVTEEAIHAKEHDQQPAAATPPVDDLSLPPQETSVVLEEIVRPFQEKEQTPPPQLVTADAESSDIPVSPLASSPESTLQSTVPSYSSLVSSPMPIITRKATDPILYSDPYPYSLSTPGSEPLRKDVREAASEHSYTASEDKDTDTDIEHHKEGEDLSLPSDRESVSLRFESVPQFIQDDLQESDVPRLSSIAASSIPVNVEERQIPDVEMLPVQNEEDNKSSLDDSANMGDEAVEAFLEAVIHDEEQVRDAVRKNEVETNTNDILPPRLDAPEQNVEKQIDKVPPQSDSSRDTAALRPTMMTDEEIEKYLEEAQQMERGGLSARSKVVGSESDPPMTDEEIEGFLENAQQPDRAGSPETECVSGSGDVTDKPLTTAEEIEKYLEAAQQKEIVASKGAKQEEGSKGTTAEEVEELLDDAQLKERSVSTRDSEQQSSLPNEVLVGNLPELESATQLDGHLPPLRITKDESGPAEGTDEDVDAFLQGITSKTPDPTLDTVNHTPPDADIDSFLEDIKEERSTPTVQQREKPHYLDPEEPKDLDGTQETIATDDHATDEDIDAFLGSVKSEAPAPPIEHTRSSDSIVPDADIENFLKDVKNEKARPTPSRPRKHRSLIPPPMWSWDKYHEAPENEVTDRHDTLANGHAEVRLKAGDKPTSSVTEDQLPSISDEDLNAFLEHVTDESQVSSGTSNGRIMMEKDPFKLMGSGSNVAPGAVDEKTVPTANASSTSNTLKRKRGGTKSHETAKPSNIEVVIVTDKGKRRARPLSKPESSSSASSAARLLEGSSQSSSRASSVAALGDQIAPSPADIRPKLVPPPMLHVHSHRTSSYLHQPIAGPSQPRPQPQRAPTIPALPRTTNSPSPSPPSLVERNSPEPVNQSPHPADSTSSPRAVTRSHCRYHRISLPQEEGGPRIFFLVPGCSISDKELMKEEEIEDHGDATLEDSKRMIADLESLNFNSYLIGTLRQLVGVDLLREQEVYYLPEPGKEEQIAKKKAKPDRSAVSKLSSRTLPDGMSSPTSSIRSPLSSRPPISIASTVSLLHTDNDGIFSASESESSDESDGGSAGEGEYRLSKKVKHSLNDGSDLQTSSGKRPNHKDKGLSKDASEYKPEEDEESEPDPASGKRSSHKRKRLQKDAAEYKPEEEEESEHTDKETTPRPKAKRKHRLKRSRTIEGNEEMVPDDRQIKKARTADAQL